VDPYGSTIGGRPAVFPVDRGAAFPRIVHLPRKCSEKTQLDDLPAILAHGGARLRAVGLA
jgi:hypothetical protein